MSEVLWVLLRPIALQACQYLLTWPVIWTILQLTTTISIHIVYHPNLTNTGHLDELAVFRIKVIFHAPGA